MNHDITDAVGYAISAGIAIPSKIAIIGLSYGGYATLWGMTFTPETSMPVEWTQLAYQI